MYKAALRVAPGHAPTLNNFALLREEAFGDAPGAEALLCRAAAADPADPAPLAHRAMLRWDHFHVRTTSM
jgi:hypothetical protein